MLLLYTFACLCLFLLPNLFLLLISFHVWKIVLSLACALILVFILIIIILIFYSLHSWSSTLFFIEIYVLLIKQFISRTLPTSDCHGFIRYFCCSLSHWINVLFWHHKTSRFFIQLFCVQIKALILSRCRFNEWFSNVLCSWRF